MSAMSNLAIDVEYALTGELNARADEACVCGDADLRNGLYRFANASYLKAAHYRRAAQAIRDGLPLHPEDEPTVRALRTRFEQQLLAVAKEASK